MTAPLAGIKVLEMALQYPGPYCSTIMAGLGADILKVERPGTGDAARRRPAFFNPINRNKKSLTLDLKSPKGVEILHRLAAQCDVVTEGFRPGVVGRLGIDYATLSRINPRLVYCSISGYGQSGPYSDLPGHDLNYMALSGMLNCFLDDHEMPILPGVAIADLSAGMFAAIGIMAALAGRQTTGKGRYVEISMLDGLLSWMATNLSLYADTGLTQKQRDAGYGLFKTRDGKLLALGIAHENWFWDRLCMLVGLEQLVGIPGLERNQRREELIEPLKNILLQKDLDEWVQLFKEADVPATPVLDMGEVLQDAHVKMREMVAVVSDKKGMKSVQPGFPIKFFPEARVSVERDAPALGEHTAEILGALGYRAEDIQRFRDDGVV